MEPAVVDHTYIPNEVLVAPYPGKVCHLCGLAAEVFMPCIDHCGQAPLGKDGEFFCAGCAEQWER